MIHTGFIHDFQRFTEVCEIDRIAIIAIGEALAGTNRPFIITSGTAVISPGRMATEDIAAPGSSPHPRKSEQAAAAVTPLGVTTTIIRLAPSVHGKGDKGGFIPMLIDIAKKKGVFA